MKLPKYRIPLLTAWSLIGYAKKDGDSYTYDLNVTETSQAIRGGEFTLQEDTPIFFQAMCLLEGENYEQPESHRVVSELSDVLFYILKFRMTTSPPSAKPIPARAYLSGISRTEPHRDHKRKGSDETPSEPRSNPKNAVK